MRFEGQKKENRLFRVGSLTGFPTMPFAPIFLNLLMQVGASSMV